MPSRYFITEPDEPRDQRQHEHGSDREPGLARHAREPAAREHRERRDDDREHRERDQAVGPCGAGRVEGGSLGWLGRQRARADVLGIAAPADRAPDQAGVARAGEPDRDRAVQQIDALRDEPGLLAQLVGGRPELELADDEAKRRVALGAEDDATAARDRERACAGDRARRIARIAQIRGNRSEAIERIAVEARAQREQPDDREDRQRAPVAD